MEIDHSLWLKNAVFPFNVVVFSYILAKTEGKTSLRGLRETRHFSSAYTHLRVSDACDFLDTAK
jgi:hypothetical protein